MRTVRINPKHSPVSGSLTATSNRFLNYAEIVADARKRVDMEKSYYAERVITLSNSTGKQPVYMVVQTCVTARWLPTSTLNRVLHQFRSQPGKSGRRYIF